jgi:antitoxin (DNA-binding transcriptional repressor) of toxin-antitoxin stability system
VSRSGLIDLPAAFSAPASGNGSSLKIDRVVCTHHVFTWDMAMAEQNKKPQPRRVGVREFRGNLTGFLRQARHGATFLVTSHDQVLAEIRPPAKAEKPRRRPGTLRGRIRVAPDFDTLPPDVLAAMEGEEE